MIINEGISAGSAFSGTIIGGSGDNLNYQATTTSGFRIRLLTGSAGAPDATLDTPLKLNRTISMTAASITADGAEQVTGMESIITGTAANQVQTIGVMGAATNQGTTLHSPISPDATGGYFVGGTTGTGAVGNGIGIFANGQALSAASLASGAQINVSNSTGSNNTVNATGFSTTVGVWLTTNGTNTAGAGIQLGNGFGRQFDVGLHFNGQVNGGLTGPTATNDIRSDSHAATAILLNGTYGTAAIAVAATAGAVLIGGTTVTSSPALLEVQGGAANANPLLFVGSTTNHFSYRIKVGNTTGSVGLFVTAGAGQVLTGTADGDTGLVVPSGTFHIGGTTSTIKVNSSNQLGFYNVTAIAQPSAAGSATGYTAGATAATFHSDDTYTGNTGSTGYTINGIVAALKNLGLIHT